MFIIWFDEASSRADYVEIGAAIRSRTHGGRKPDLVLVMLDEINGFIQMRGKTGQTDYQDYINDVETCMAEDGRVEQIDEFYAFTRLPKSSEWRK